MIYTCVHLDKRKLISILKTYIQGLNFKNKEQYLSKNRYI